MSTTIDIEYNIPILRKDEYHSRITYLFQLSPQSPRERTYQELVEILIEFLYKDSCKINPPFVKENREGNKTRCEFREDKVKWTWNELDENAFTLQSFDPNTVMRVENDVAIIIINQEQTRFTRKENPDTFSYIYKIYENLKERKRRDDRRYIVDSVDLLREGEKK